MTTLAELVLLEPDPTFGAEIQRPATSGVWRMVLELADPSAGSYVEWFDLTDYYAGDRYQRGADDYMGRARAAHGEVQLQAADDRLAPWGQDTTALFGTDVTLDAGLLMRLGYIRVVSGVVVEWQPDWTGRVEVWGDSTEARGQIRKHVISVIDTMSDLANVPTISVDNAIFWDEYLQDNLDNAAWPFGADMYGDTTSIAYVQDLSMVAAITRMDAGSDPAGVVWRTLRTGRLIVYPPPWDTTNTARWPNPLLDTYPDGLVFSYSPDFTEIEYIQDDGEQSFGVSRSIAGIINSIIVTADADIYPIDDPVSIARYGTRPFTATWINENHPVVDDLLAARAYASTQALPLRTTLDHEGFWSALALVDHLDPITVIHQTADDGPVVTAVGTVRNIVEERTWRGDGLLSWQSTIQIDITSTEVVEALLPVESLVFEGSETSPLGGPSSAEFSWVNPTQPSITPTDAQYRVLGQSLIWTDMPYAGVGADGVLVNWLEPATPYTFQVRLIRRVDGVITNSSPIREIDFTTAARIMPVPTPGEDPGDTDVIGTPPDGECDDFEVDLQENDGSGWVTVDTFTGAELTENGDGTYSLTTPIDNSFFNEGSVYRFRSSCDGVTWLVGPSFDPPDDWTDPCTTPPALADAPFNDDDLLVYVPKICAPDIIREAVSGIEGVKGSGYQEIVSFVSGDPNYRALLAVPQPEWAAAPGGIIAYGECPQITGHTGDKTIVCRANIADEDENVVLFECAGMQLKVVASSGGFRAVVVVYKPGVTVTLPSASEFIAGTYYFAATFEDATGDITLYVDAVQENTVGGTDNVGTITALPIWRVGAPPESWITDCAVFDRVLAVTELPGYVTPTLLATLLALSPTWLLKLDETAGSNANDSTANNNDGTYTLGTLAGKAGPGGNYYDLDGTGAFVSWSVGKQINASGTSCVVFIKPDTNGATREIASLLNIVGGYAWDFNFSNTGKQEFAILTTGGANIKKIQVASANITTGAWQMVAFTTTGRTTGATLKLYRNGSDAGGTVTTGAGTYTNSSASSLLGHRADGISPAQAWGLDGGMAYATWWDGVVLTPTDIANIWAAAQAEGW